MNGNVLQLWKYFIGSLAVMVVTNIGCYTVFASKQNTEGTSNHSIEKKRQELIPYPRVGRSLDSVQEFLLGIHKLIPKAAASDFKTNADSDPTEDEKMSRLPEMTFISSEYMLPYPRPGRSSGNSDYNDDFGAESDIFMVPLAKMKASAKPGVNIGGITEISSPRNEFDPRIRRSTDYITPYPRMGKRTTSDHTMDRASFLDVPIERAVDYINLVKKLTKRLALTTIPYPNMNSRQDIEESDYMTPYPRIGKRDLLYYPRPGRDQSDEMSKEDYEKFSKFMGKNSEYMTPYPRIGKRISNTAKYWSRVRKPLLENSNTDGLTPHNHNVTVYSHRNRRLMKRFASDGDTMLPYPRIGRSGYDDESVDSQNETIDENQETMIPYPRFGRSWNINRLTRKSETITKHHNKDRNKAHKFPILMETNNVDQNYMVPYPRPGRSNDKTSTMDNSEHEILLSNDDDLYILPYPRFGK